MRAEACSKGHLLTHMPKNPFCDVCTKAKMQKPPSKTKGGSSKVEAQVFGDHIAGDCLVTMDDEEEGIDSERIALVVKDVATGFIYVYPSARRNTESIILAMKHFTGPADKVGIFYSDNAPELVAAMKILQWRHTISKDYISKSNAVAESLVRSILEGTRVNLLQSGLHHQYWPHAARHWCFMCNVIQIGEEITPWKLRFGEDYKGPKIPFGCQIDYWTGPRKRPKSDLKFEPTSKPGIFLGYVVHPGFDFRTEFIVASLQDMRVANFEDKVNVVRVIKVSEPEVINFPLQDRLTRTRDGCDQAPVEELDDMFPEEAVLCSDWVPNECIICVYDAQLRDFYHINRGYPACRKKYNEKIREHKAGEPVFVESHLTDLNAMVDSNFEFFASEFGRGTLKSFPNTRREVTDTKRQKPGME